ncbi:hypothetical protein ACFY2H_39225 [Streptomyces griseofuscus]
MTTPRGADAAAWTMKVQENGVLLRAGAMSLAGGALGEPLIAVQIAELK